MRVDETPADWEHRRVTAREIQGQCLCGAVQISLASPKERVEICHCEMCQRWGGACYAGLTGEQFTVSGEASIRKFRSSSWAERAFCGRCGSHLWYEFLPAKHMSFLAGLFSDAAEYPVEKEIFVDERSRWCTLPGDHVKQTGPEVIKEAKAAGFVFDS